MRASFEDVVRIKWGVLMLVASKSRGMWIDNDSLKFLETMSRSWMMWIQVEAVTGRLPEAVTYRAWATTVILTVLAVWGLRRTKMPQQQATQHGEPTPHQ